MSGFIDEEVGVPVCLLLFDNKSQEHLSKSGSKSICQILVNSIRYNTAYST